MSIRALFIAVGAAWGAILGGLVGLAAYVFAFGVGWLYIFGDDTWPEAASWALPSFAALAGFLTFGLCVAVGWLYGGRAVASGADQRHIRRTGFGLLGLSAAALVGIAVMSLIGTGQEVADHEQRQAREAAFTSFSATHHTADRIDFFGWNADVGSAGIVMRGNRDGDYHISWRVTETTYRQVLAEGRELVSLGPGRRTVVIGFERGDLIAAYREKVLKGAGGVIVDEAFRLEATVEPALSREESASMPPRELQNLAIGKSSLRSGVGIDLPMSFRLPAAPEIQTD